MKYLIKILLILIPFIINGQVFYKVSSGNNADLIVYEVNSPHKADIVAKKVNSKHKVDKDRNFWYFTNNSLEADQKIYFTNNSLNADYKVYFDKNSYNTTERVIDRPSYEELLGWYNEVFEESEKNSCDMAEEDLWELYKEMNGIE